MVHPEEIGTISFPGAMLLCGVVGGGKLVGFDVDAGGVLGGGVAVAGEVGLPIPKLLKMDASSAAISVPGDVTVLGETVETPGEPSEPPPPENPPPNASSPSSASCCPCPVSVAG